jgi:predicted O-methyltransferase YrrM
MDADKAILKLFRTQDRPDNMPRLLKRGRRDDLGKLFKTLKFTRGVEVGTKRGEFAETLCRAHPDMQLFCIDPWTAYDSGPGLIGQAWQDKMFAQAAKRLAEYKVSIIRKTSMDAVKEFEEQSIDFVFIDGNHTFDHVMLDLIHWAKRVRKGGIVSLHDYRAGQWAGVVEAVNAYTASHAVWPWYATREREPTVFWVVR